MKQKILCYKVYSQAPIKLTPRELPCIKTTRSNRSTPVKFTERTERIKRHKVLPYRVQGTVVSMLTNPSTKHSKSRTRTPSFIKKSEDPFIKNSKETMELAKIQITNSLERLRRIISKR